ncbi:iron-sulfur cluster biosynthesis family protein [Alkalicoccus saliphilus]|nr:iron-sulfur cluster biosynthesis family protein [Alkalicoccus saliphilus]
MKVEITDRAVEELRQKEFLPEESVLFISHETAGTGCVVNGVSDLIAMKSEDLPDAAVRLETVPHEFTAAIDKRVDWIYDEHLIVDFNDTPSMFQLKSPNQMLNPRMTYRGKESKV